MPEGKKSTITKRIKKYREKLGASQDCLNRIADVAYDATIKIEFGANQSLIIETMTKLSKPSALARMI